MQKCTVTPFVFKKTTGDKHVEIFLCHMTNYKVLHRLTEMHSQDIHHNHYSESNDVQHVKVKVTDHCNAACFLLNTATFAW